MSALDRRLFVTDDHCVTEECRPEVDRGLTTEWCIVNLEIGQDQGGENVTGTSYSVFFCNMYYDLNILLCKNTYCSLFLSAPGNNAIPPGRGDDLWITSKPCEYQIAFLLERPIADCSMKKKTKQTFSPDKLNRLRMWCHGGWRSPWLQPLNGRKTTEGHLYLPCLSSAKTQNIYIYIWNVK